ncbi:hypothetical protein FPV67DRAFT_1460815 [Lyophyllum atratum]|nr:hypothetical protein FPV67DRAFT_1460815 [Lyophyllum atratum]
MTVNLDDCKPRRQRASATLSLDHSQTRRQLQAKLTEAFSEPGQPPETQLRRFGAEHLRDMMGRVRLRMFGVLQRAATCLANGATRQKPVSASMGRLVPIARHDWDLLGYDRAWSDMSTVLYFRGWTFTDMFPNIMFIVIAFAHLLLTLPIDHINAKIYDGPAPLHETQHLDSRRVPSPDHQSNHTTRSSCSAVIRRKRRPSRSSRSSRGSTFSLLATQGHRISGARTVPAASTANSSVGRVTRGGRFVSANVEEQLYYDDEEVMRVLAHTDSEMKLLDVHVEMEDIEATMLKKMVDVHIAVEGEGDVAMGLAKASMTISRGQQLGSMDAAVDLVFEKEAEEKLKEISEARQVAKQIVEKAQEDYRAMRRLKMAEKGAKDDGEKRADRKGKRERRTRRKLKRNLLSPPSARTTVLVPYRLPLSPSPSILSQRQLDNDPPPMNSTKTLVTHHNNLSTSWKLLPQPISFRLHAGQSHPIVTSPTNKAPQLSRRVPTAIYEMRRHKNNKRGDEKGEKHWMGDKRDEEEDYCEEYSSEEISEEELNTDMKIGVHNEINKENKDGNDASAQAYSPKDNSNKESISSEGSTQDNWEAAQDDDASHAEI